MLSVSSFFSKATSHLKWFVDAESFFYFFFFKCSRPSGPTDLKISMGNRRVFYNYCAAPGRKPRDQDEKQQASDFIWI